MSRLPLALGLALLLGCVHASERAPVQVSDGRVVMGTILEVTLYAPDAARGRRAIDALFERAAELDAMLSHFDPHSAVRVLGRDAGRAPRPVPAELAELLSLALDVARRTDGAFDPTVGPLVELWTAAARRERRPDPDELAAARARVGFGSIQVDARRGLAGLSRGGAALNLGAIAKGYALDVLSGELRAAGIEAALLDFGGSSLQAIGAPPGDRWRVLLRAAGQGFAGRVELRDAALAVSSSVGQVAWIDGRRYGHVIDPRSGEPIAAERLAAVISDSGALADALSTALLVLDADARARVLGRIPNTEALVLEPNRPPSPSAGWSSAAHFEPLRSGSGQHPPGLRRVRRSALQPRPSGR